MGRKVRATVREHRPGWTMLSSLEVPVGLFQRLVTLHAEERAKLEAAAPPGEIVRFSMADVVRRILSQSVGVPAPERRLTVAEVEKEVRDITTRTWPHNSVLRMKNLYDQRVGCIFRTYGGGPGTIQSEVFFPEKEAAPVPYLTLTAMVEAGWVVD